MSKNDRASTMMRDGYKNGTIDNNTQFQNVAEEIISDELLTKTVLTLNEYG